MLRLGSFLFNLTSGPGIFHANSTQNLAFLTDETFGKKSPLDSVLKIEGMMRACRSNSESMQWCMLQMADLCLNRCLAPAEMQPNYLFGTKGGGKGNFGLIVLNYFISFNDHQTTLKLAEDVFTNTNRQK